MAQQQKTSWNDLSPEQKKQYFLDYYLVKVLIGFAAVLLVGYTVWSFLRPKPSYLLSIGLYDVSLSDAAREDMIHAMQKELHTAEPIQLDDGFSSLNNDDLMRIVSLSTGGRLDGIIADRDVFEWLAGYGYFKDLTLACDSDFLEQHKDSLILCKGLKTGEGGLLEEDAEGNGALYTAGVAVGGTKLAYWLPELKEPVFGILAESEAVNEIETILSGLRK